MQQKTKIGLLYGSIAIAFLFIVNSLFKKKSLMETNSTNNTNTNNTDTSSNLPELKESDFINAFANLQKKYGKNIAQIVEKIYRLETAHFRSLGFKKTYGAGALAFSGVNYGWGAINLLSYGVKNTWSWLVNGKKFTYLVFDNFDKGLNFLADYLIRNAKDKGIDYAVQKWGGSPNYLNKVKSITSKYIK